MKRIIFTLLAMATMSCARAAEWKLVWSDEFDKPGLPDRAKWNYESGLVRNHEAQYYTKDRLENARVENGMLVIEGRKEAFADAEGKHPASYTSASLTTKGRASWTYGRIEVRARLPQGKGVWPAFWTLGVNIPEIGWPKCGEIDIMEFVGKEPDLIHGTVHYSLNGKHQSSGHRIKANRPFDAFHIYAVEWFPDHVDFFYDKQKYHTFEVGKAGEGDEKPFHKAHYMLINLALGGSWGGPIDDSILPQKYLIDYVRVYRMQE